MNIHIMSPRDREHFWLTQYVYALIGLNVYNKLMVNL